MSPDLAETRPNVAVIFTDDQGYGDLSCFGAPNIRIPNVDRIAREGVRFTSFYVGGPICTPSRASLMIGCYPRRVGLDEGVLFPGDREGLNSNERTIADIVSDVGGATTCIGKWHLEIDHRSSQQTMALTATSAFQIAMTLLCSTLLISERCLDSMFECVLSRFSV